MLGQATKKLSKMHARRNPNLSIQSTATYSQLSPSVQSATSGAFLSPTVASRRGLLSGRSPPASPSLPSLVPRHGKKPTQQSHTRLVKRILVGCCGVAFLLWIVLRQIYSDSQQAVSYVDDEQEWEMVGGSSLPKEPSVVAVQDAKGKMKWTVSIPSNLDFPLKPAQYLDMCHQCMELASSVRQEAKSGNIAKRMLNYYQQDQYYVDVQEAEQQSLLPPSKETGRPKGFVEDESIVDGFSTSGQKVCDKSLTYVMETDDAGFGNTLMRLWMSYGLAKAENRSFFIDDTRWPYGKYSTYFQPPPSTNCAPPPKSHIVPCPHTARHLVVSHATVKSTFGHAFNEEYEDARKMRIERQHKIFALLRTGYEALFKLKGDDAKYVLNRALELYGDIKQHGGISIGMHVRHGDKHPMEYQYQKDYIPLERYVDTARDIYIDLVENAGGKAKRSDGEGEALFARHTPSKMIIASDDPLVYTSPEIGLNSLRAQDRIVLATKAALEAAQSSKHPYLDEITGWEGGFYKDVFFSLGQAGNNAKANNHEGEVTKDAMGLRELVGRAYLLDIAVLGKADTVVCTVSSTTCRLLGVMLGWDAMVGKEEERRWRSIDGSFQWKGIMW
ncbi:hypothetical protein HBH98_033940 [Parastagonospora nodorum]|nr:hypothetical protein HBH52_043980 [Parastagonospora nodorum]KAH4040303.1 hypothetical protein HBI09_026310 [Parastagonospora nodorum]KAH4071379.1 hypothetical protein HBH50_079950 [Parastagonospora nodorum]KAH4094074.1 hypothetical protein HBH48_068200 [Parastagonospora nodorum]KAH4109534.1 hypothetical protein HBH46_026980 [Parastagonospora nodorum]